MKIRIFETQRGFLERETNAKIQLNKLSKRVLPGAFLVAFTFALGGYALRLVDLWAFIAISCVPLLPIVLLIVAGRTERKTRSWTLTDHTLRMSDGFFMPLRSIVRWEVNTINGATSEYKITVKNKGEIARSIEIADDHASREFINELKQKCGNPSSAIYSR